MPPVARWGDTGLVLKSASGRTDSVYCVVPLSSRGGIAGSAMLASTFAVCQAATAGTLMLPIVTSEPDPCKVPTGVSTTCARVAGATPYDALAIWAVTASVLPQVAVPGKTPTDAVTSWAGCAGAIWINDWS